VLHERALTLLLTTMAVVGLGCGYNSYESRLAGTEAAIKEQLRLDHYLIPAPQGQVPGDRRLHPAAEAAGAHQEIPARGPARRHV
jgi:hypothetical protein